MQSIRQEIHHLTTSLQAQNQQLYKLLQQFSILKCPHRSVQLPSEHNCSVEHSISSMEEQVHRKNKFVEATNASRVSSSTVKQSSRRGLSPSYVKESRITQKSQSWRKTKKSFSQPKRGVKMSQEPMMSRLKKIAQKPLSKVPSSVLLHKKSKIYHFKPNY